MSHHQLTDANTAAAPLPAPRPPGQTSGMLFAAAGAILFSTKAIAIKLAYEEPIDAETLLALRMIISLPVFVFIGAWSVLDRRREGRGFPGWRLIFGTIILGLVGFWLSSYFDFLGLEYISAQLERLILFTYPVFVVIFGALFFRQPISRRAVIAIGISYAGLVTVLSQDLAEGGDGIVTGSLLVLACAIMFALYQLFAKDYISQIGPRLFTCIAMSAGAAGAIGQFFLTHPPSMLHVSGRTWTLAAFIAIGSTVLPSFLMSAALHRIPAQTNAAIGTLSPIVTIILAWAILGEAMTLIGWLGTALVIAGIGWFTLAERLKG